MLTKYGEMLLSGNTKLGMWGMGYLGYSDVVKYAINNVSCVISDYSQARLEKIKLKFSPIDGLRNYLDHVPANYDITKCIEIKTDFRGLLNKDVLVHILTIPTQTESTPSNKWMMDALKVFIGIREINYETPPVLIIESSLIPGTLDRLILPYMKENGLTPGKNIHIGICSRTDWFDQNGRFIDAPRVISGVNKEAIDIIADIIEITGSDVIKTSDYHIVELIKSVEHSFYQMSLTMANQLALAFPNLDIVEMMRLAALRGGLPGIQPNFGSGGYEIPVACQYVMEGAEAAEYLSIFRETNYADLAMPKMIAEVILRNKIQRLGILGISSTSNMKITAMSPALRIINYLKDKMEVKCCDPFYSDSEIRSITGVEPLSFPSEISYFDGIIISCGHRSFRKVHSAALIDKLIDCRLILDNIGIWKDLQWSKVNSTSYRRVGIPGWNR